MLVPSEEVACTVTAAHAKDNQIVVYPLQNSGNLGSQDGTGVGEAGEAMFTLTAHGRVHGAVHPLQNGGCRGEEVSLGLGDDGDPMFTLTAAGRPHGVVVADAVHPRVVGTLMACGAGLDRVASAGNEQDFVIVHPAEVAATLTTRTSRGPQSDEVIVVADETRYVARRLLPVEAERLQGFPDGYTDVPMGGKPASDTVRYKGLGNSMAVPCVRYVGELIEAMERL